MHKDTRHYFQMKKSSLLGIWLTIAIFSVDFSMLNVCILCQKENKRNYCLTSKYNKNSQISIN